MADTPRDTPRIYDDLARLWPYLSPPEHYADESQSLRELIDLSLGEPSDGSRWSVLEIGAGGGHGIFHLKEHYDCTAADLSPQMLANCQTLNPNVPRIVGDMRDMRIDKTFDAVLICDAIDYMTTRDDAVAALTTAAAHTRPGGVVLVAPTYTRETFVDGETADDALDIDQASAADPTLAGVTYFTFVHDPDPDDTAFEMILLYLLRDAKTQQVEVIEDRHQCGLFSIQDWLAMMQEAGLEPEALAEPTDEDEPQTPSAWSVMFRGTPVVR